MFNLIGMILIYGFVELLVNMSPSLTEKKNNLFQKAALEIKSWFN